MQRGLLCTLLTDWPVIHSIPLRQDSCSILLDILSEFFLLPFHGLVLMCNSCLIALSNFILPSH